METNYLKNRQRFIDSISVDFESEMCINEFIEHLIAIRRDLKKKYGILFIQAVFSEKRVGYEDWYFEVDCEHWESECEFIERCINEEKQESIRQQEFLDNIEKERIKKELDKEIKKLQEKRRKL